MKYTNAKKLLPEKLIIEIQQYIQGETIYIPKQEKEYSRWGTLSGGRQWLDHRNAAIRLAFKNNSSMEQLAEEYFLSIDTIKRIVYSHRKRLMKFLHQSFSMSKMILSYCFHIDSLLQTLEYELPLKSIQMGNT